VWDVPERALAFGIILQSIRLHGKMEVGLPSGPRSFALAIRKKASARWPQPDL
jgi:hypothetical protein